MSTTIFSNSSLGRLRLLLGLDKARYLRSLLLISGIQILVGIFFFLIFPVLSYIILSGAQDLPIYSMSAPSYTNLSLYVYISMSLMVYSVAYYLNQSIQHAGARAFSILPARLREKCGVSIISALIIVLTLAVALFLSMVFIFLLRNDGTFSLIGALRGVFDFFRETMSDMFALPGENVVGWREHLRFWDVRVYFLSILCLFFMLAIRLPSILKGALISGCYAFVLIIFMSGFFDANILDGDSRSVILTLISLIVSIGSICYSYRYLRRIPC